MIKKNIIIAGNVAGAGKDTMAGYLESKYGYKQVAFATGIKRVAREVFNMQKKDRALLQDIGQKMREIDPEVWVKALFREIDASLHSIPFVISDLRQKNELSAALERNFIPVRVVTNRNIAVQRLLERDGVCDISKLDGPAEDGTRKIHLPQIYNNGTFTDFYQSIDEFLDSISI